VNIQTKRPPVNAAAGRRRVRLAFHPSLSYTRPVSPVARFTTRGAADAARRVE